MYDEFLSIVAKFIPNLIFRCLHVITVDNDAPDDEDLDLTGRFVHLLDQSDVKMHFEMILRLRSEFESTGSEQKSKLLPSIFSQFCELGRKVFESEPELSQEAFKRAHETVQMVANADFALGFRK